MRVQMETQKIIGTKWIRFCSLISYPLGAVGTIWASLDTPVSQGPAPIIVAFLIAVVFVAIAYGLHRRRLWSWWVNACVVVLSTASLVAETFTGHNSLNIVVVMVFAAAWLWVNYRYWNRRLYLFRARNA
jgi:hypothetical protein